MFALEENHPSRRRPLRVAVAVLSAMALAGVSALALQHRSGSKPVVLVPQATTPVTCGQLITVSIVVGNDLNCSGNNGLNVGHASITINLNGHTLTGDTSHNGIDNPNFATVTITNGTVSGWVIGVFSHGAATKVTGIRATLGTFGIVLSGTGSSATGNVVFRNFASASAVGIDVAAPNIKVTSNAVRENNGVGIQVDGGVTGAVVQTNQSENNVQVGIIDTGTGTAIIGNVANANASHGIDNSADPTGTVATNTANYNGALGIKGSPSGKDGGGDTAKGNTTATQCADVVCS